MSKNLPSSINNASPSDETDPQKDDASSPPRLRACEWRNFNSLQNLAQWDMLAKECSEPNPFYESWFLLPSLNHFDPQNDARLLLLEADGILFGLMPVVCEKNYYGYPITHWRNWNHANAFLGVPLVKAGYEAEFWNAVLAWCDAQGGWPAFLHLAQLTKDGPLHDALAQAVDGKARAGTTVLNEERALLDSDLSPEEYFNASLSTKKRKELRRQHRRLSEQGELAFERRNDDVGLPIWIEQFLALEQSGWKGDAGSSLASDEATNQLFKDVLYGAANQGKLERLTMTIDGKPIAMLVNFHSSPGGFSFKTAFDEAYSRFSPGVLLQQENLAVLERENIDWVDSCAAKDHPMIDHFWREKRTIVGHSIAIGGSLKRGLFQLISRKETGSAPRGIL